MDPKRYARIKETFAHARELSGDEREEYLSLACVGDDDLRAEVRELIESDREHAGDAFDRALSDDEGFELSLARSRPQRIGKYRILGIAGSGGMGTVYEAEQDTPLRRVAIKVLHSSTPRPDLLHRFRRETEILARLQHPCIAQVFEAGEFEQEGTTCPYFAMEFVDGVPLLEFVARHALDVSERLELFTRICDAVHYAHLQGVVHRDLKPDNIFIVESPSSAMGTGSNTESHAASTAVRSAAPAGQPKILDFGVASISNSDARLTMATEVGQLLGSVLYMSPEQAAGSVGEIDARSDVYSLGVVLFELLAGRLPYQVRHCALVDALHQIRYHEPSRLGSADPGLRGDLETIVGKCLEKDKDRRYDSVATLVEDIRRYLQLRPIHARPPSTWYQLRRFTQRNGALVGGVSTAVLALVVGAILAIGFALRSHEHAEVSRREAYRANISSVSALLESDPAHARRVLAGIPDPMRGWEWSYLSSALSGFLLEFGEVAAKFEVPAPGQYPHHLERRSFCLLADGNHVIAQSDAKEFGIWEVHTGRAVRTFSAPSNVRAFDVSREGNLLAAALPGGRVVVADPRLEVPIWSTWFESETEVERVAVDPNGTHLAISRSTEVRFGRPGAWQVSEIGTRGFSDPPVLEYSHDGSRIAFTAASSTVRICDAATGSLLASSASTTGHWSIAFAPEDQRLAIGQEFRSIRVVDSVSGELDFELHGHQGNVTHVAHGPRNQLLSVSTDGTIRVWDLMHGKDAAIFDAPGTTRAEFVDDQHILTLTEGRFRLWTLEDRRVRDFVGHRTYVYGAVFSGDGGLLVTTAPLLGGDTILWDPLEPESPLHRFSNSGQYCYAFDAEGERLMFWTGATVPWSEATGLPPHEPRPSLQHGLTGAGKLVIQGAEHPLPLAGPKVFRTEYGLEPDGAPARAFVDGHELELGLPQTGGDLGPHPMLALGGAGQGGVSISELIVFDGPLPAAAGAAIDAYLASRATRDDAELPEPEGCPAVLAHFVADPDTVRRDDEDHVLSWVASNNSRLELEARGRPRALASFLPTEAGTPAQVQFDQGNGGSRWLEMPFPEVAGKTRLTVCWRGEYAEEWHESQLAYRIGTADVGWMGRDPRITKLGRPTAFSADGKYVADSVGGAIVVRDTKTGYGVANFDGADYEGVSFHPDSMRLAMGTTAGTIECFDVKTQERVASVAAHANGRCYDVAFSPDGTRLASGGNDNAVRIWDADTLSPLLELPGHRSYVMCLAWSPDGTMLASASGDHGVRVWDSVSPRLRYAELLADRARVLEATSEVESWHARTDDRQNVIDEIRKRWPHDAARRRAALKVLARL